jgi:hypothetical protein
MANGDVACYCAYSAGLQRQMKGVDRLTGYGCIEPCNCKRKNSAEDERKIPSMQMYVRGRLVGVAGWHVSAVVVEI